MRLRRYDRNILAVRIIPFNKAVRMAISMSCCPSEPIRKTVICIRKMGGKENSFQT